MNAIRPASRCRDRCSPAHYSSFPDLSRPSRGSVAPRPAPAAGHAKHPSPQPRHRLQPVIAPLLLLAAASSLVADRPVLALPLIALWAIAERPLPSLPPGRRPWYGGLGPDPLRRAFRLLQRSAGGRVASASPPSNRPYDRLKRLFDVAFALALGLLALPLCALVSLVIALDSPGGVLYSQTRVGLNGRRFRIYKFRSMRLDAERHGAVYAIDRDPRVTRVGRLLRLSRIDELPQLWNVLRGEMSVVGPRPERPEFTATLEQAIPRYAERYQAKPGLTGWAQVRYRYTSTVEDTARKLEFDRYYLRHASIWLDLRILVETVRVVLGRQGR